MTSYNKDQEDPLLVSYLAFWFFLASWGVNSFHEGFIEWGIFNLFKIFPVLRECARGYIY